MEGAAVEPTHAGSPRLLMLGGTRYVGRSIVHRALSQGWRVTAFNRGLNGRDVPGVDSVRGDRYSPSDIEALAAFGPWDAVVDASGYVPANTLSVAQSLHAVARRYVFISTVSVYEDWPIRPLSEDSPVLYSPPDADAEYGTDTEDGPTKYGYQKSGCEAAVRATFGIDRSTILRPGVVLGPRDYVGRLAWWLRRVAAGGDVLAPGLPDRGIQPIDVRDVARFATQVARDGISGTFNVAAPIDHTTFEAMLDACATATASNARFVWAADDLLIREGVRQWSEMPLWRTFPGVWHVESRQAIAAGLTCRPIHETVVDTWHWLNSDDPDSNDERSGEIGLSPEKESRVLRQAMSSPREGD